MIRRLSWLLLSLGLVLVSVGDVALSAETAAVNATRLRAAANAVLAAGPVRREMTRRVEAEVLRQVPGADSLDPASLDAVASATLQDPRFENAFADALVHVQDHVFAREQGPVVVDATAVTAAVRRALAAEDPALLTALTASSTLAVTIDTGGAPDLHLLRTPLALATRAGLGLGLIFVVVGVAAASRRRRAVTRVARWAIVVGPAQAMILWVVPRYVLAAFGAWPTVAAALVRAATTPLVVVVLAFAAAGAVTISLAHRFDTIDRRRARAAALEQLTRRTSWRPPPRQRIPDPPAPASGKRPRASR